jgi:hypothetical protein
VQAGCFRLLCLREVEKSVFDRRAVVYYAFEGNTAHFRMKSFPPCLLFISPNLRAGIFQHKSTCGTRTHSGMNDAVPIIVGVLAND